MALGSGRGRLARQLLTESLSLAMAAAALGMLFAQWGSRLLVRFLSTGRDPMFLDLAIDGRVLAFTIAVAVATGLLFGLAPAWRGTRVDPNSAIRATARGVAEGSSRFTLGKALMVAQVALSLVLLIGAGLLIGTFRKLATLDPGFERDRVLLVNVDLRNAKYPPARREQAFQEMLDHLRAILGVRSASESRITPMSGRGLNTLIRVDGYVPKSRRDPLVWMNGVSSEFFRTMGTALVAGRDFDQHDTATSHPVAIVNESMTRKFFAGLNPVGKYFRYADDPNTATPVEIVGVVKDAKYRNLRDPFEATVYVPSGQTEIAGTNVVFELLTTGSPNDLIPSVKAEMEQVNRDITMQFSTFSGQVAESLTRERLLATLSGFFGGLALLLASIGLYGVMSYNMARRRNEIGIRMALGAAQGNVLRMVLGEIALLLAGGMIAGLLAALAATRLVATFLYGLTATAPAILALAALVLASVATLAGYLPARRASRLDPMAALREE